MTPKQVVQKWVDAFNKNDIETLSALYTETAINHQVNTDLIKGKKVITKMFIDKFAKS